MSRAIKTSIDASGRLVVPKPVRDQAGLVPGMALEVSYREGRVEIEPAPREVRIVQRGSVCVAESPEDLEKLTSETVRQT